jgi:hypothetical protein
MFDRLFSSPQPWVFGHLYLPGGSSNLGAEEYRLESGSQAPLVGVLMEVTRAARLMDGKLLILATATARFKVRPARPSGRGARRRPQLVVDGGGAFRVFASGCRRR